MVTRSKTAVLLFDVIQASDDAPSVAANTTCDAAELVEPRDQESTQSQPLPIEDESTASEIGETSESTASEVGIVSEFTASEVERLVSIMTPEEVWRRLQVFEKKYGISSKEFYRRWQAGREVSGIDTLRWVALWEAWRDRYLIES